MKSKKDHRHRVAKVSVEERTTETHETAAVVQDRSQESEAEPRPAATVSDEPKSSSTPQMSRVQQHWISRMLIFADCAVQKTPDGVFDVLARNFESTGALSWWLDRIGRGEIAKYTKGKDIVDAIRKVAHELYRDLRDIGKPVARW